MAYYPRKTLTDLWKPGVAKQDCICSCCKDDIEKGVSGWVSVRPHAKGYYSFLCILCWDTWTAGDIHIGLAGISSFRKEKSTINKQSK